MESKLLVRWLFWIVQVSSGLGPLQEDERWKDARPLCHLNVVCSTHPDQNTITLAPLPAKTKQKQEFSSQLRLRLPPWPWKSTRKILCLDEIKILRTFVANNFSGQHWRRQRPRVGNVRAAKMVIHSTCPPFQLSQLSKWPYHHWY